LERERGREEEREKMTLFGLEERRKREKKKRGKENVLTVLYHTMAQTFI